MKIKKGMAIFTWFSESYSFGIVAYHVIPEGQITQKQLRYFLLSEVLTKQSGPRLLVKYRSLVKNTCTITFWLCSQQINPLIN